MIPERYALQRVTLESLHICYICLLNPSLLTKSVFSCGQQNSQSVLFHPMHQQNVSLQNLAAVVDDV